MTTIIKNNTFIHIEISKELAKACSYKGVTGYFGKQ